MTPLEAQPDELQRELQRVLASKMFSQSDAMRRLLSYLGERAAGRDPGALKEYTIGVEAFEKSATYDPQEDPTVRVVASKLRRRLDEYYLTEGAGRPYRIEIPKGHYQLQLVPQAGTVAERQVDHAALARRWRLAALALAGCLALALVAFLVFPPAGAPWAKTPGASTIGWSGDLEAFWRPFLDSRRPILIVFGAPLFTKFSGAFFRDPRLNLWEEAEQSERMRKVQQTLESRYAHPVFNYTGIGEANGIFLLVRLLHSRRPDCLLKRSTALTWDDLRTHNVILLGSPKFIPQLKDLPFEQDFVIDRGSVRNLRPKNGEPPAYKEVQTPSHSAVLEDYALVTRLPGLQGLGNITILGSSSTEGTWAAADYVTAPTHAAEMVSRIRLPSGRLPDAFQVLIRAKFKDMVPVESNYVTHRVLQVTTLKGAP